MGHGWVGTAALPVRELWVFGDLLGERRDLDWVSVAVGVDLPVHEVPWLCMPPGAQQWLELTRASKNPISVLWRSVHAPVWNHRIVRPALVWDIRVGIHEQVLTAISNGRGSSAALETPSVGEQVARMQDELEVSLAELTRRTEEYETLHYIRLGVRADALHAAAKGYLDVRAAQRSIATEDC
jgi:hypothetical protein